MIGRCDCGGYFDGETLWESMCGGETLTVKDERGLYIWCVSCGCLWQPGWIYSWAGYEDDCDPAYNESVVWIGDGSEPPYYEDLAYQWLAAGLECTYWAYFKESKQSW